MIRITEKIFLKEMKIINEELFTRIHIYGCIRYDEFFYKLEERV